MPLQASVDEHLLDRAQKATPNIEKPWEISDGAWREIDVLSDDTVQEIITVQDKFAGVVRDLREKEVAIEELQKDLANCRSGSLGVSEDISSEKPRCHTPPIQDMAARLKDCCKVISKWTRQKETDWAREECRRAVVRDADFWLEVERATSWEKQRAGLYPSHPLEDGEQTRGACQATEERLWILLQRRATLQKTFGVLELLGGSRRARRSSMP